MSSEDLPKFRWCVHFETGDGKSSWLDQVAKHPAGAKKATIDELERMGHEVEEFYTVTRTDAKQSRAAMRMMWGEPDGPVDLFFDIVIGRLFDRERWLEYDDTVILSMQDQEQKVNGMISVLQERRH